MFINRTICSLVIILLATWDTTSAQTWLTQGRESAHHRGVYQVVLRAETTISDPWFIEIVQVTFARPDGSEVTVDGFYNGNDQWIARAYCDAVGAWKWRSVSDIPGLSEKSGSFQVTPSELPGKLRIHPDDPYQFAYDNGDWYLHIGDTGYRYVVATEPYWREYIDQAAEAGFTKIRTWYAQSRNNIEACFTPDRSALNLPYWQEMERRLLYAFNTYPHIQIHLIPYAEDTEELKRYGAGDIPSQTVAQYSQARWSSFPNVHWVFSNDREVVPDGTELKGRRVPRSIINQIGRDMKAREPWDTLLSNHQSRFKGYDFVDADWSDIITLEDLDQVSGQLLLDYRAKGQAPAILDEDRYERYRRPTNPRYFFRRFMWASLLSGGHATYGGLRMYEAWDGTPYRGIQGYYDACRRGTLYQGAHDFIRIHQFFREAQLTLVGMTPDDALVGGNPLKWKCAHGNDTWLVFLANPDGDDPCTDNGSILQAQVTLTLPMGAYTVRWFDPAEGAWYDGENVNGGAHTLSAPAPDYASPVRPDWVLLIRKM
jgi:hypothetical protein